MQDHNELEELVRSIIYRNAQNCQSLYQFERLFVNSNKLYVFINTNTNNIDRKSVEKLTQDLENSIDCALNKTNHSFIREVYVTAIESKQHHLNVHTNTSQKQHENVRKQKKQRIQIPNVKKTIMVCSGKGGVGKSSVSANIAMFLQMAGYNVGLLDADIYGPSIQQIFGITDNPIIQNNVFLPQKKHGINIMSMGFIMNTNDALVWRGPMVTKMLYQLLMGTDWRLVKLQLMKSELDFLVIDTPPGTGDVHLSLIENYIIDGAVIVSTPQKLALLNAHKSVDMLHKLNVKILGIIENMSYIVSDEQKKFIFGEGHVAKYSTEHSIPLLGTIPFIPEMSAAFDAGNMKWWQNTDTAYKLVMQNICEIIVRMLK